MVWFVARNPDVSISRLLGVLKVTKQSLGGRWRRWRAPASSSRRAGSADRRQRVLTLTDKGRELERRLSLVLRRRLARAYRAAGGEAVEGFASVLLG